MTKYPNSDSTLSTPSLLHRARYSMPDYYTPYTPAYRQAAVVGVPLERFLCAGPAERAALYMITTWAMRVGEWLGVRVSDIMTNDMIFVRGEKGSMDYLISAPGISEQVRTATDLRPGRFVSGTTYQRVYRASVRLGLGLHLPGHINLARTHAARYHLAADIVPRGTSAVSDCLRHRSNTSASHYIGAGG